MISRIDDRTPFEQESDRIISALSEVIVWSGPAVSSFALIAVAVECAILGSNGDLVIAREYVRDVVDKMFIGYQEIQEEDAREQHGGET